MSEKILVIFPGALGDFICFLPALEELTKRGGLDLLARAEYADLLPETVKARSLECYEITRLFVAGAERDERLRDFFGAYAFIYSWMGSSQPDFFRHLHVLSNGKVRIFPFSLSRLRIHMTDYYLSCLGEKRPRKILPAVPLRSSALAWSQRFCQQVGLEEKRILILAPGSGAKEKNWPVQSYKGVADWWEKRGGQSIVVMGPVEEERGKIADPWDGAIVVRGLDLAQLAALLTRCDLYLGNDSGVTHLAAALGVETVALFGPTDLVRWAPRGKRVAVVSQYIECSPCVDPVMRDCPHRKCLTALSPNDVIGILEEALRMSQGMDELASASLTR